MERRTGSQVSFGRNGTQISGTSIRKKEMRLINQLMLSVILFLTVVVGKNVFPEKMVQCRDDILSLIVSNTDFRNAFTNIGKSITYDRNVLGNLESFCSEVFGPIAISKNTLSQPSVSLQNQADPLPQDTPSEGPNLKLQRNNVTEFDRKIERDPSFVLLTDKKSSVPAAGTILVKADYHGPALSKRDTMDYLSLGDLETTTPVIGRQTSQYGWRTHPISKKQHFHGGVDISGKMGAPIGAFADGTVEYIGRDDSYGIYIQLDHGNGVKSFYAHCSDLCAAKGQKVKMGERIAYIGSTGCSTGPHLHLELKCGNKRLNPAHYIQFTNI